MPYLPNLHTTAEIHDWFVRRVNQTPDAFWVVRSEQEIVGYMLLDGPSLDDLYVHPDYQGRGIGSALLEKAKALSPQRLELSTFQQNVRARAFYEARSFQVTGCTDGRNEEGVPDVQFAWSGF